jgi:hypothetical protein
MTTNEVMIDDSDDVGFAVPAVAPHSSLAVSLARAEVDQQIATAHAFPRSVTKAVKNILTLATLDEQAAAECAYALPRAGKPIKGPSVRLAEIVASQWGNCRVGARVVHVDRIEKYVEAEGVFHDLETNTATTARVRRRLSTKTGKLFDDDMIIVTGNAACAIAKRNAILGGVPRAAWGKGYEAAISVLAGDVKTLTERRDRALKAFAAFGVAPEQVFAALEVGGIDDVTLEHMPTLIAMHSSLKSGEATVEEMFPKERPETKKNLAADLDMAAPPAEPAKKPKTKSATPPQEGTPPHDPKTGEIIAEETPAVEHPSEPVPSDGVSREHGEAGEPQSPASPISKIKEPTWLLTARGIAAQGSVALRAYLAKLGAPAYERLEPYLEDLQDAADAADAAGAQ